MRRTGLLIALLAATANPVGASPPVTASSLPSAGLPTASAAAAATDACGGDSIAPDARVASVAPLPGTSVETDRPLIALHLAADVDPRTFDVRFDGLDVTNETLRWPRGLLLGFTQLRAACHSVVVAVATPSGGRIERRWRFHSSTTKGVPALAFYQPAESGDAIPRLFYVSGTAPAHADVFALAGIDTLPASSKNGIVLASGATETHATADGDGQFNLTVPSQTDAAGRGTIALVAVDPSSGTLSIGILTSLRAPTRWCPEGSQHTLGAGTSGDVHQELATFDRAQNQLCIGNYAAAKQLYAANLPAMRADRATDGHRILDFYTGYFYALLASGSSDAAARFLRTIDRNRAPLAADRLFYAAKYDAAGAAYDAYRKQRAAQGDVGTDASFAALLAGNEAARKRDWPGAFDNWIDAAGVHHQVMEFDSYDDFNISALQMMYYYRAHIPADARTH